MQHHASRIAVLMLLSWVLTLRAQPDELIDPNEPPIAGQPELFDGAVGTYRVTLRAAPTTVRVGELLILTIRITATGPLIHPPRRPDLRQQPEFGRRFHFDFTGTAERMLAEARAWEFDYGLRPSTTTIAGVPNFRFDYFTPGFLPPELGYQTTWGYAIPLQVLPSLVVKPEDLPIAASSAHVAELSAQLIRGPAVLQRQRSFAPPPWLFSAALLAPPLACTAWYLTWRLRNGIAVSWRSGSRSARQALLRLHQQPAASAATAAEITLGYITKRFGLAVTSPAPEEIGQRLQECGICGTVVDAVVAFFHETDAVHFGPPYGRQERAWSVTAADLISELEAST